MIKPIVLCLALLTGLSDSCTGQELSRRAFLGIRMEAVTDDVRRVMDLPAVKGVLVRSVIPNSTAAAAGLQQRDVLLTINGTEVNSPDEAVRIIGDLSAGAEMSYTYIREGKTIDRKSTVQAYPREEYADLSLSYGSIVAGGTTLRTIITKPQKTSGRMPAMLFIQGIGCYSVDTPFDTTRAETQLVNAIARAGYVVMRVDKAGIGDSKGIACGDLDFNMELLGYTNAFASLRERADVDPDRCFVFGHSMGGVMAPALAQSLPVQGIIAYGTLAVNFMEYFTLTRRGISRAFEMSPAVADEFVRNQCACAAMLVSAKLSREEAVSRNAACGEVYDFLLDRDEEFWYQLDALNIPGLWQQYAGSVLSLRGEMDYITSREEHEYIAEVVNSAHPGRATFMEMAHSGHGMQIAASFSDASNGPGTFNPAIAQTVVNWLRKQSGSAPVTPIVSDKATEVLWTDGVENAYPRLSADGRRILFQSNRSGKWHLYTMGSDGSDVRQLTSGNHNNNFPDWSADERRVAFVSDRDGNEEVYVMNMDGTGLRRLTFNPARDIHPYFSPDATSLLFNSSRDNANSFEIYRIGTDGTGEKRLTSTPDVETCARYSPDQRQILFLMGFANGSDEICVMDTDGNNVRTLTDTPQMEGWPVWSPDGRKIVFSSRRGGHYCLYEMNADGGDVRQLSFPGPAFEDARAAYAADADVIVFNRQRGDTIGIYLLPCDED